MDLNELKMRIAESLDEVTILELLDIHADELVEAFSDKIEEKQNYIRTQLELDLDGDTDPDTDNNSDC